MQKEGFGLESRTEGQVDNQHCAQQHLKVMMSYSHNNTYPRPCATSPFWKHFGANRTRHSACRVVAEVPPSSLFFELALATFKISDVRLRHVEYPFRCRSVLPCNFASMSTIRRWNFFDEVGISSMIDTDRDLWVGVRSKGLREEMNSGSSRQATFRRSSVGVWMQNAYATCHVCSTNVLGPDHSIWCVKCQLFLTENNVKPFKGS